MDSRLAAATLFVASTSSLEKLPVRVTFVPLSNFQLFHSCSLGGGQQIKLHHNSLCSKSLASIHHACSNIVTFFFLEMQECKKSGVNFIAPEHILLAMLSLPDGGGRKALER